jgi:hypothetical protein
MKKKLDQDQDGKSKIVKPSQRQLAIMSERGKKFKPHVTKEACIADLRRVQEEHPFSHISRNFYRNNGTFSDATWNQHFGTFHEFRRQAKLELSRGAHQIEKQIAKHAAMDLFRDFYSEKVLPYHNKFDHYLEKKGSRFKTVMVCSDLHDIELDMFVFGIFVDQARQIQPDVISLAGDISDCPEFGKYSQDPRAFKLKERLTFIREKILRPLREACPNAQIDFVVGNHDLRILKLLAEQTPAMRVLLSDVLGLSLADIFGLDEYDVNLVCKVDLAAFSTTDVKDELKENFRVYYGALAVHHYKDLSMGISGNSGHTHRPHTDVFVTLPMGSCTWTQMGCMKHLRTEYVGHQNKWTNSFAINHIDTLKDSVQTNHVIIPADSAIVNGKLYTRK